MRIPSFLRFSIFLAGLCAVSARGIPSLRHPYPYIETSSHHVRTTGTGPQGFLSRDESFSHGAAKFQVAPATNGTVNNGTIHSACLVDTTASVADCQAVIGDIRDNNGTISVAPGLCLNWWEGGCLGRVCGRAQVYSENSGVIADAMTSRILDTCISYGRAGAVADCADFNGNCGTYRLSLQTYVNVGA
ncbi:hypothetical protein F4779DRAFT_584020 [Xylariaceae sp. FL0662B]|nr:hypothetical protein F4779DRAFT_584020 [Xylariaceae sp. FL0662B]